MNRLAMASLIEIVSTIMGENVISCSNKLVFKSNTHVPQLHGSYKNVHEYLTASIIARIDRYLCQVPQFVGALRSELLMN
jgi:hypothetical protein